MLTLPIVQYIIYVLNCRLSYLEDCNPAPDEMVDPKWIEDEIIFNKETLKTMLDIEDSLEKINNFMINDPEFNKPTKLKV